MCWTKKKEKRKRFLLALDQQGASPGKGVCCQMYHWIIIQGPEWARLLPGRRQTGSVSTECRSKLLWALKGRLQTADWLAIHYQRTLQLEGRALPTGHVTRSHAANGMEPPQMKNSTGFLCTGARINIHSLYRQKTHQHSSKLLKKKTKNEALAIVNKILQAKQNLKADWFSFSQNT